MQALLHCLIPPLCSIKNGQIQSFPTPESPQRTLNLENLLHSPDFAQHIEFRCAFDACFRQPLGDQLHGGRAASFDAVGDEAEGIAVSIHAFGVGLEGMDQSQHTLGVGVFGHLGEFFEEIGLAVGAGHAGSGMTEKASVRKHALNLNVVEVFTAFPSGAARSSFAKPTVIS